MGTSKMGNLLLNSNMKETSNLKQNSMVFLKVRLKLREVMCLINLTNMMKTVYSNYISTSENEVKKETEKGKYESLLYNF